MLPSTSSAVTSIPAAPAASAAWDGRSLRPSTTGLLDVRRRHRLGPQEEPGQRFGVDKRLGRGVQRRDRPLGVSDVRGDVIVQAKAAACEQIRHVRFVASARCQTAAGLACTKIIRKRAVSKRCRMAAVAGGRQRTTMWPLPAAMLVFHVCDQDFRKREIRLITQRSRVQIPPPLPRSEAPSTTGRGLLHAGC